MSNYRFTVTHQIVTQESAEHGECDESQSDCVTDLRLRDAVSEWRDTRTSHVGGVQCIEGDHCAVTVTNGLEFLTGAQESRTLHIPANISRASGRRLARLLGAKP